jgi:hypothetical protein
MKTTLARIIEIYSETLKKDIGDDSKLHFQMFILIMKYYMTEEREMIEKAFSDGVGEGLTDPERPFTGKEYFDVKYKKS